MFSKTLLIFSLISVACATLYVTAPVESTTYSGGKDGAVVSWINNPDAPPTLEQFGAALITIHVGNEFQQTLLQVLNNSVDVSTVSSINFTPDPTIGPNSNEYFIRIQSNTDINTNVTPSTPFQAFSSKFTLDNMTGTFNASVSAEIAGQSTAPLASHSSSGTASSSSTPSLTASSASKTPSSSSSTSATAKPSSGAMGLKAGWVGIVFGAVVGVTMF